MTLLRTRGDEARVTSVELFFDLVFVFAITQIASRVSPSMKLPATQIAPEMQSQNRMRRKFKVCETCPLTPHSMKSVRPIWIEACASAKTSPNSAKALGIEEDRMRPASMMANSIKRTGMRSGSSQLVTQDV